MRFSSPPKVFTVAVLLTVVASGVLIIKSAYFSRVDSCSEDVDHQESDVQLGGLTPRGDPAGPDDVVGGLRVRVDLEKGRTELSADVSGYVTIIASGDVGAYTLHAYDNSDRHTGSRDGWSLISNFEEKIPNSSFEVFGGRYYLVLNSRDEYRVELLGRRSGEFRLQVITGLAGDIDAPAFYYPGGRVTRGFRASLHLPVGVSVPPALRVDADGDCKYETSQEYYRK